MDKKTIGELAEYVSVNFRNESMAVSTGLDILSTALDNIKDNLIIQQEGLRKINYNIEAGELDDFIVVIDELVEQVELYSDLFDISTEEEDFEFLDLPVDYGPTQ